VCASWPDLKQSARHRRPTHAGGGRLVSSVIQTCKQVGGTRSPSIMMRLPGTARERRDCYTMPVVLPTPQGRRLTVCVGRRGGGGDGKGEDRRVRHPGSGESHFRGTLGMRLFQLTSVFVFFVFFMGAHTLAGINRPASLSRRTGRLETREIGIRTRSRRNCGWGRGEPPGWAGSTLFHSAPRA
jgi:hypothetical protein